MASAPSDRPPVTGRVDPAGRLIKADAPLALLQSDAGSELGAELALPQLAALARLARELGVSVERAVIAAAADHDLDLWVRATPDEGGVELSIERWRERPIAGPRLVALAAGTLEPGRGTNDWETDDELRLTRIGTQLARRLAVDGQAVLGQPLARILRLIEESDGDLPLLAALAGRRAFRHQRAAGRGAAAVSMLLSAEPRTTADGRFVGYAGIASEFSAQPSPGRADEGNESPADTPLDRALRTPLDQIIRAADHIVGRTDGPLRSDYANYAGDIAAAARHMLEVLRSIADFAPSDVRTVDLAQLARDAAAMVQAQGEKRQVVVDLTKLDRSFMARGEERAVTQILVNIIGNAIRHSPDGGQIAVSGGSDGTVGRLTVADSGPGIEPADQQRIFERFERVGESPGSTGLGLAIARRLARGMGGDITLDSKPGAGARFTLKLPAG